MKELHYKKILHILGISLAFSILYFCVTRVDDSGIAIPHLDKIVHMFCYLFLSLIYFIIYDKNKYKMIFLICFGYGIFIELVQYFLPYRSCSLLDVFSNVLGIFIAYGLIELIKKK
jgi:VanZ family protein